MKKYTKYYTLFALLMLLCLVADIIFGSVSIPFGDIIENIFLHGTSDSISAGDEYVRDILFSFRIPKAVTALLAGIGLSLCGLQMQTLFKNPLADPYILGVSASSGLGVAVFVMGGTLLGLDMGHPLFQIFGIAGAAMAGAFLLMMLIISLSHKGGRSYQHKVLPGISFLFALSLSVLYMEETNPFLIPSLKMRQF